MGLPNTTTKRSVGDLAVLGGEPAFGETLRVGRPNIGDREAFLRRVNAALDTRSLTNDGPYVRELEQRICQFLGVEHAVAVCNATVGLEIAIRALGMTGEVIVPSFTFVATAHALQWQGITPAFADVGLDSHTLDPASVEAAITPRTTGIIGVHLWGRGCDTDALTKLADSHGLPLMFDAAHAFGCTHDGQMVGNFGQAEVFSFHATKFLNSLEGGAIVTNDPEVAARARHMRNFGISGPDEVGSDGTNGKMNEISAAMGLTSLDAFDRFVDINRRNYTAYIEAFEGIPGVAVSRYDLDEQLNYQYVVTEVNTEPGGLSRDELQRVLEAENVGARRYFYPGCHRMPPFRSSPRSELPATEKLAQTVLCYPTGTSVDEAAISRIGEVVRLAAANPKEVRSRLSG